ncbi:hypothetical protein DEO72_LG9g1977 [Vigna unguiculata]|uniref:Uncharacterized protein n=1 Tax=Vigna unguiculata TaxID=3917 RepID=A0A4D6N1X9_VIGUN|nr:hypothetical protein DEO72_LG9g1977 [Vigna unguiculata]
MAVLQLPEKTEKEVHQRRQRRDSGWRRKLRKGETREGQERERERERDTINGGAAQGARSCGGCNGRRWSKVVGGGRRWPEGVVAVGAAKKEREREGKELQRRRGEEEGFAKLEP